MALTQAKGHGLSTANRRGGVPVPALVLRERHMCGEAVAHLPVLRPRDHRAASSAARTDSRRRASHLASTRLPRGE